MLKPRVGETENFVMFPAAFGRLCVETNWSVVAVPLRWQPAAFGRLCVETGLSQMAKHNREHQPPSGGCVLKLDDGVTSAEQTPSRLRAAVC